MLRPWLHDLPVDAKSIALCMKQLKVLGTEEARDLAKAYELLVGQLADFENENIKVGIGGSNRVHERNR